MNKKKIVIAGVHKEITKNIEIDKYEIIDADTELKTINDFDNGNIQLRNVTEQFDFDKIGIDQYWRMKGEFDHYTNRRVIKFGHEEQDLLFRTILHRVAKLCKCADGIILSNLPHQGVDSILSNYAKILKIPVYYFTPSIFKNYSYLLSDERDFSNLIPATYRRDNKENLYFDNTSKQEVYYMKSEYFHQKKKLFQKFRTFIKLLKIGKVVPFRTLFEKIWEYYLHSGYRSIKWKEHLEFDQNKLNIYIPLHLQPELTTSNMGGLFYDQNYAISKVIQHCETINADYQIYIKENPKQSATHRAFLDQFKQNNKIHFVSVKYPSDLLIDYCDVVCTVSGTAGWEAIKSGKPCLIFGRTWYETAPGVEKNIKSLSKKLKMKNIDKDMINDWFCQHQRYLHLFQNDTTVAEMSSFIDESRQTLKSVIKTVF